METKNRIKNIISKKEILNRLKKQVDLFKLEVLKVMDLKELRKKAFNEMEVNIKKERGEIIFHCWDVPSNYYLAPTSTYRTHKTENIIFNNNFEIERTDGFVRAWSYNKLILEHDIKKGIVYFNNQKYSSTTSKLQNKAIQWYGDILLNIYKIN